MAVLMTGSPGTTSVTRESSNFLHGMMLSRSVWNMEETWHLFSLLRRTTSSLDYQRKSLPGLVEMTLPMKEHGSGMMEPLGATKTGKMGNQMILAEMKIV